MKKIHIPLKRVYVDVLRDLVKAATGKTAPTSREACVAALEALGADSFSNFMEYPEGVEVPWKSIRTTYAYSKATGEVFAKCVYNNS